MKINKIFLYAMLITFLVAVFFFKNYWFDSGSVEIKNNVQQENMKTENFSYKVENYHSFLTESGEIHIIDSNYMVALTEVFYNLDRYQGRDIILEGFVHREDYYGNNQFMLARRILSCCEEHAVIMGLISHWEDIEEIKEGTWIRVKGMLQSTIHYSPENDREATWPIIIVEELEKIEKPEEEYIQHEI